MRNQYYTILVGKPEDNRLLGIPKRGWKNNIKMVLGTMVCQDVDRINRPQDMGPGDPGFRKRLRISDWPSIPVASQGGLFCYYFYQ